MGAPWGISKLKKLLLKFFNPKIVTLNTIENERPKVIII